ELAIDAESMVRIQPSPAESRAANQRPHGDGCNVAAPKTPAIAAHADPAISIPGTSAKLRAGRIDQLTQRQSEVVDHRVARKACNDAALRPDQRHDRAVGEGIFVWCRAGHLVEDNAKGTCSPRQLLSIPAQRQNARVEVLYILAQRVGRVPLRVDRDEDGLHLHRQRPKLSERAGNFAERRRAQVWAISIAEKDEQPAPAQIDGADQIAAGIRQLEVNTRAEAGRRCVCGLAVASRGLVAIRRADGTSDTMLRCKTEPELTTRSGTAINPESGRCW